MKNEQLNNGLVWHALSVDELILILDSHVDGLKNEQVVGRLKQYGKNELISLRRFGVWRMFFAQFNDFMVLVLVVACIISGWAGSAEDAVAIGAIVLLNAMVGFAQEFRADKALQALKQLSSPKCMVKRAGHVAELPSVELVPGDLVLLEAGGRVPADIRLLEATGLRIDESTFTGESLPVDKYANQIGPNQLPLGERLNMAYMDTMVIAGKGIGLVVETGMRTELGKIAGMLSAKVGETPLQLRMKHFGKQLTVAVFFICLLLFIYGWYSGQPLIDVLLLSISLGVAAIPEALPALITLALSLGAARLVFKKALVRQLSAVETLGSVTCICSDKTGTLTCNRMKVRKVAAFEAFNGSDQHACVSLEEAMALNVDIRPAEDGGFKGDPTELAIYEYAFGQLGVERLKQVQSAAQKISEIPFDSISRKMTTIHYMNGVYIELIKGAPEAISDVLSDGFSISWLTEEANRMSGDGLRVLAYAASESFTEPTSSTQKGTVRLLGICGLQDPPRPGVFDAVRQCKEAGIRPVMITGDHPRTAEAIGKEIGIMDEHGLVMDGTALSKLDPVEFRQKISSVQVFARVDPLQKLQIVKMMQQSGDTVAMTGDGVNDAPALRSADIGVAMGLSGTDVSRQAAHLVLLDDDFTTIVSAVREGRRIEDNIRKFIRYTLSCNGAEVLIIAGAPFFGLPMPLLPIQILYINLVTDGLPGIALAGEEQEHDSMSRPPRSVKQSFFAEGIGIHILWVGSAMAILIFLLEAWALRVSAAHMSTIIFTALSFLQFAHVLAIRNERRHFYQAGIGRNKALLLVVTVTALVQLAILYFEPARKFLHLHQLSLEELLLSLLPAVLLFHAVEFEKIIRRRMKR